MFLKYRKLASSFLRNLPYSLSARPYSDLLFVSEGANWVTSWEIRELSQLMDRMGLVYRFSGPLPAGLPRQSIFMANRYNVMLHPERYLIGGNRMAFPYYHGHPDSGDPLFIRCYSNLKLFHDRICRIQVSNSRMYDLTMSSGIDPSKVFLIPIGINTGFFPGQTVESKKAMRDRYGIPQSAVVIGSFQKDGHGWKDGGVPKLEKGPDIFLKTLGILKESVPGLFILLSGPARGYVRNGLDNIKVPYKHVFLEDYPRISELYHCLDLYMVASREEGGPKAVLESMSSGIPLVTTRVGQARDLVRHGENGWVVDSEDIEGLAYWAEKALADGTDMERLKEEGFKTAEANTYNAQYDDWRRFFRGFVEGGRE